MSVPEGERTEGKFHLGIKAEELVRYTLTITANDKVFVPDYQRALTDDIIEQAKNAYIFIRGANDVVVRMGTPFQEEDWLKREALQKDAIACLRRLLYLIDLAYRVFHLSGKRVKYWSAMIIYVRKKAESWMESDRRRYSII